MTKITISVTRDDIDKGERKATNLCPIALALRRLMPDVIPVVFEYSAMIGAVPHRHEVQLPPAAADFVCDFDAGNTVAPFAFGLDVPDELAPAVNPVTACGKKWGSPSGGSQTCVRQPAGHDGKHRDSAGREWARRRDTKNARPSDRQEARHG